ncbi:hypothetical protein [Scytonema sp. NUACC26]|uniref:hypothetical protein n=1 Tax=Scytonema sp. NUACC26 TaxID=3140176 RepID=UPI0034DBD110
MITLPTQNSLIIAIATEENHAIQLEFSEAPDKAFKVEISYQDAVVIQEFVQ